MLQEKLNYLLEKYAVDAPATLGDKAVTVGGETLPTLAHRFERRFIELRNLMNDGSLGEASVFRFGRMVAKGSCLTGEVMRELDLCRFISGREVVEICAFVRDDKVANIVAKLDNGVVCTLEVSATLPVGADPIDKHEITSRRGVACDRVVDSQVPQSSIYLFSDEGNEAWQDVDFECYGLKVEAVAEVRAAFALAKDSTLRAEFAAHAQALAKVKAAYEKSALNGEKVVL